MYIEKNGTVLNVSKGAYIALFEQDGWRKVKDPGKAEKHAQSGNFMSPQPTKKDEEVTETKVEEVPFGNLFQGNDETSVENPDEDLDEDYEVVLEDMTVKELKAYAEEKDIDLDGATKKEDIIGMIRAELED
nr:MAG TPA: dimeris T4 recombination endonuclease VII [Caudoviricetes sp.]